jgi:hypothetical protein
MFYDKVSSLGRPNSGASVDARVGNSFLSQSNKFALGRPFVPICRKGKFLSSLWLLAARAIGAEDALLIGRMKHPLLITSVTLRPLRRTWEA